MGKVFLSEDVKNQLLGIVSVAIIIDVLYWIFTGFDEWLSIPLILSISATMALLVFINDDLSESSNSDKDLEDDIKEADNHSLNLFNVPDNSSSLEEINITKSSEELETDIKYDEKIPIEIDCIVTAKDADSVSDGIYEWLKQNNHEVNTEEFQEKREKMTLNQIVNMIDPSIDLGKTKLVRHINNAINFNALIKDNLIEEYQSLQSKNVFVDCEYIISFIADGGSRSIFYGLYKVGDIESGNYEQLASQKLQHYDPGIGKSSFKYQLERNHSFDDISQRLIIDWGKAAISWHQWANNEKQIIEILPKGYLKEFPGFLDFILDYNDLKTMVNNPESNKIWHQMLSSVYAIYLITDYRTGQQYVGSAYGEKDGLLGRWKNYANTGHGGNKLLVELLKDDPEYARNFTFTILRTLPKTLTDQEVISKENLYKDKLGSKVFGLNSN